MVQSYSQIVWQEFKSHKAACVGLAIVIVFALIGLLAPLIGLVTDLDPQTQNPLKRYLPPRTYSELSSSEKEFLIEDYEKKFPNKAQSLRSHFTHLDPSVYAIEQDALYTWILQESPSAKKHFQELSTTLEKDLKQDLHGLWKKSRTYHLFGTDELGRDVFIRLVYGTRVSLGVGLLVALTSAFLGLLVGSIAGYFGGWVDHTLMRITDALLSLPLMPVLIVVSAISFEKVPFLNLWIQGQNENIFKLVTILVLFSWMTVARLVRAEVLSLREREFILASKTLGATDLFIILKHIFPNVLAPLLVSVTLGIGESIQFEAALSFLGLGIQQPTPSWGNMLFNAQELITEAPFLAALPGLLILTITICFNYMGDGLQEAVNPKAIKR
jgi:peptide/nickel transport system permease protein